MIFKYIKSLILAGVAAMLLSSCNGLFEDIYDNIADESVSEYGFISLATDTQTGTIYVDASSYTKWIYLNFSEQRADSVSVYETDPQDWDLAIHRYDAKTNGGAVAETDVTDFSLLSSANVGEYVSDIWTTQKIVTDMSTMMDGYLSYVESDYNEVLSQWLDVDTSNMPPSYTLSGKIYILRLADGTKAALKLENYMNESAVKGYMTIRYMYPIEK
jgi:hypothetical protein